MHTYCIFFNPPNTCPSFSFRRRNIGIFEIFLAIFSFSSVIHHYVFIICLIISILWWISIPFIRHLSVTFPSFSVIYPSSNLFKALNSLNTRLLINLCSLQTSQFSREFSGFQALKSRLPALRRWV